MMCDHRIETGSGTIPIYFRRTLRGFFATCIAAASIWCAAPSMAETVVTVAMTAGDIPITTGIPDQGGEGARFVGLNLYDPLMKWDLSRSDVIADLVPGL